MSHDGNLAEDEYEVPQQEERHYSWGCRPNFKQLLNGGQNKLMLTLPPEPVIDYFKDQVYNSFGCTYDSSDMTFFATSQGRNGRGEGTVMSFSGNCDSLPVCVASGLEKPAAIAVFEPGSSVAVVTDRGIYVFKRVKNDEGETTSYSSRKVTYRGQHRGIAVTAGGNIVSGAYGKLRLLDGGVSDGEEIVLASVDYASIINDALFKDNQRRASGRASPCFMDIVENRLVMSDLNKHVISMWEIEETVNGLASITFVRAIDVQACDNQMGTNRLRGAQVPLGKCVFASGIRLDEASWVMVADADGRTLQIFDDKLKFVTRVETPSNLGMMPYMSGIYIEANGHLIVCDRRNEMGGLRVYLLEAQPDDGFLQRLQQEQAANMLVTRMNQRNPNPARIQPAAEDRLKNYGYAGGSVDYGREYARQHGRGNFSGSGGYGRPYNDRDSRGGRERDW